VFCDKRIRIRLMLPYNKNGYLQNGSIIEVL
jgi:hypothetical protein